MSYRRSLTRSAELRRYYAFCQNHGPLIEQTGIPLLVFEEYETFLYFIMHGSTYPMPQTQFNLSEMSAEQRDAHLHLLRLYLGAGFPNPNLGGLTEEVRRQVQSRD